MKYTRNITNKLKLLGFEYNYESDDENLLFEVWSKGALEVSINHTIKIINISVPEPVDMVKCTSLDHLKILDKMLNK